MSHQYSGQPLAPTPPENYERFFVPYIGAPLADDLIDDAELKPGEQVLDVACGTGVVARLASHRVGPEGAVVGVDVNPGMLAVARTVHPTNPTIEWHQASAERMPLPDERFDAVLCQMGLQFMEDPLGALGEMRRVLKEGGRLILNVPGPAPSMFKVFARSMGRHIAPEAAGFALGVFSLHDIDGIHGLMAEAGFPEARAAARTRTLHLPPSQDFLWQYVFSTPLAGVVSKADDNARAALEREVVENWREFEEDDGMSLSLRVVTVSAQK